MSRDCWNRCDECGKFIPMADFDSGAATRHMVIPDNAFGGEVYETLCAKHAVADRLRSEALAAVRGGGGEKEGTTR